MAYIGGKMRIFEPVGKEHRQLFVIDGHYIEKVWKRVGWNTFKLEAVYDKCGDMLAAKRRLLRYTMKLI